MNIGTPRLGGRGERHQLDLAQPSLVGVDARQLEVRIGGGVAVPGKVLAAAAHAGRLEAAPEGERLRAPPLRASVPNARSPMIGLAGLVCTSSTGA